MKTVLITGASSGIGKTCAELFLSNGYKVYNFDLKRSLNENIETIICDVTNEESVINAFSNIKEVDVLVSPTCPNTAFDIGSKTEDPLAMYLTDIATISANLAGIPGMSLPAGFDKDGMPIGLQILAPQMKEADLFNFAYKFEQQHDFYKQIANV